MILAAALCFASFAVLATDAEDEPPHRSSVLVEDVSSGALLEAAEIVTPVGAQSTRAVVILPETHRSELVRRVAPASGTVDVHLWSAGGMRDLRAELAYVDHAPENLIVAVDGEVVELVSPSLPWNVETSPGRSALPELARLDGVVKMGVVAPDGSADADAPSTLRTVAARPDAEDERAEADRFALPGPVATSLRTAGCHQPLRAHRGRGAGPVDQLVLAREARSATGVRVPTSIADALELDAEGRPGSRIDVRATEASWDGAADRVLPLRGTVSDDPAEGRTRTWILTLEFTPLGSGRAFSEARTDATTHARFADVADEAGIALSHLEGPPLQLDIRPTMGPGAAWGDVDGDGLPDLYLVQGGGRPGSLVPRDRLFRNRGDGTFEDVTIASGIDERGAGMGALFCDLDSDGDLDLYVANYGPDALFLNDGDGRFARADHLLPGHDLWSAGVAAADYDRDGDLDLYITSYLDYDESKMPGTEELARYRREDPVAMLPFAFPGQRNVFLRSDLDGALAFTDATEELGLLDAEGRGMQPIFWDFDQDGDDDLYVANDVGFNVLHRNDGDGTFRDVTFMLGLDDPRGGMGLAVGDVDRDGDEDLFLSNWQLEANALYQNNLINRAGRKLHTGTFADHTVQARLGPAGIGVTSWGVELFDAENDGDLDLFVANGYTSPDYESTGICVGQPNHFFVNEGEGRFREAHAAAEPALAERLASRGAVACDYDRDGLLDLLVTANNGRVQLLANQGPPEGHWMLLRLRGSNGNTHAIGARVEARCGEDRFVASLRAGTGYLTGNPPELHLGLGDHARVDELVVHWPSGRTTTHAEIDADRIVTLAEPE